MKVRRTVLLATLAALAAVPAFAAASASAAAEQHEVTRSSGAVSATLSWRGAFAETKNFRIQIARQGAPVVNETVDIEDCPQEPTGFPCVWPAGDDPLAVRDLDGDAEPEVLIATFTGGAYCCVVAVIYRWTGTEYAVAERNFFSSGWKLADPDRDGTTEFRSRDPRFDSLYGPHAGSVFPLQILDYDAGRFTDVTADFPKLVVKDMRALRHEYERRAETRQRLGVRQALAAYVADLYLLDRTEAVKRTLNSALANGTLDESEADPVGPWGKKFVRSLKRKLRQFGYR